jgi:hypothetical protein
MVLDIALPERPVLSQLADVANIVRLEKAFDSRRTEEQKTPKQMSSVLCGRHGRISGLRRKVEAAIAGNKIGRSKQVARA